MIYHPEIGGGKRHYPLPYHGRKTIIHTGLQKKLIRIFQLPTDIFD